MEKLCQEILTSYEQRQAWLKELKSGVRQHLGAFRGEL
jgi:hypothetical protein